MFFSGILLLSLRPNECWKFDLCFSVSSKPSLYIWKFLFDILLKPSMKDFEHYLASMWNEHNCTIVWTFFDITLLRDYNKNWLFPVPWLLLNFINLLTYRSSLRICISSAGIPLLPLALFTVILPKAHLTSYSRMSGSWWVTTPLWLSGLLRLFLYSSSVYSCHLLVSSTSVRSLPFLSFIMFILAWNVTLIALVFLKRSYPCYCFPLFSCIVHLIRPSYLLAILSNSAFSWVYLSLSPLPFTFLLSSAICKTSRDNHFAFLHFFFCEMVLVTASCTMLWTSVHPASGTLSTRSDPICLQCWSPGIDPWVGKIPWRRKWQPTPVLLPRESHGQRSLVGYSPQGRKELDTTSLSLSLSL